MHPRHPTPPKHPPTPQDRLWETQAQLHDVARTLARPGPHGARHAADVYDILGALKVATGDIAVIVHRATRLLTDASHHGLTSRAVTPNDLARLEHVSALTQRLPEALEQAQTATNDIGGHLTSPAALSAPPWN